MENLNLRKLVTFAILMENGDGIVGKAPNYIFEKFYSVKMCSDEWQWRSLLDQFNQAKYDRYMSVWSKCL